MIDRVLENAGNGAVVFRCYEDDASGRRDFRLKPFDLRCRIVVVVLIVERQITDLQLAEREVGRRQLGKRHG
jgi:hypothetical protein